MKNMNQRINKRIIPDITREILLNGEVNFINVSSPSLESYARTEKGVYQLLTLPTRQKIRDGRARGSSFKHFAPFKI